VPAAQAAAEAAAAAAEASEASALPEDLDEFGRDRNMEKRRESSTRCQQRCCCSADAERRCDVCVDIDVGSVGMLCYVGVGPMQLFHVFSCAVRVGLVQAAHR